MKKIFLGSDHGGYVLKGELVEFLKKFPSASSNQAAEKYEIIDCGCNSPDSCDYPEFGRAVAESVVKNPGSLGIALCGSGVGISIAANRVAGARAVLANSVELAKLGREHNGANILAMGERTQFIDPWKDILTAFLSTDVDQSERHKRRREKLG